MTRDEEFGSDHRLLLREVARELKRVREARGWTRENFVDHLPSGISWRTLLSYENLDRDLSLPRFLELCVALRVSPLDVLVAAEEACDVGVEFRAVQVNLRDLIRDDATKYDLMRQWARNTVINNSALTSVEVTPDLMHEFAILMQCSSRDLALYLATFSID